MNAVARLFGRLDYALVLVLTLPPTALLIRYDWIITYPSHLDPWIYQGYFLHLPEVLTDHGVVGYHITRFAWLLPGYLLHAAFAPPVANLLLHLGFFYIAVVSMYLVLKRCAGRRAGVVAAVLMSTDPFFLWSIGWTYPDGAGIAYLLLTMWLTTRAWDSATPWKWAFAAGLAAGAMLHTQVFLVVFLPIVALYHVLLRPQGPRSGLGWEIAAAAVGSLVLTALLGAASLCLGGPFVFFAPTLTAAAHYAVHSDPSVTKTPWAQWFPGAHWLRLPIAVLMSTAASLLLSWFRITAATRAQVVLQLLFIGAAALLTALQLLGSWTLMVTWYAAYLMPWTFLAIGAQLSGALARLPYWATAAAAVGVPAVAGAMFQIPTTAKYAVRFHDWQMDFAFAGRYVVFPVLFLTIILAARWNRLRMAAVAALLCLSVPWAIRNYGASYDVLVNLPVKLNAYPSLLEADEIVRSMTPPPHRVRFWYRFATADHPYLCMCESLTSLFGWGRALFGHEFPALPKDADLKAGTDLVILSIDGNVLPAASASLRSAGVDIRDKGQRQIIRGPIKLTMTFVEVVAADR